MFFKFYFKETNQLLNIEGVWTTPLFISAKVVVIMIGL